jgi:DNA-binding Lrp family transcriptional regulator
MPQLTLTQRQHLEELQAQQLSQAAIARRLGVHRSTVKREVERNTVNGKYSAAGAQQKYEGRRQQAGRLNQQKRAVYYYFLEEKVLIAAWKKIAMSKRTPDSPPAKKHPYYKEWERRLRYNRTWKRDERKRTARRQYRRWRYEEWKLWYDRRKRDRCYRVEELRRARPYWWPFRSRRPWRKSSLPQRMGWRVTKRQFGPLESDIKKENAYWDAWSSAVSRLTVKIKQKKAAESEPAKSLPPEQSQLLKFLFFYGRLLSAVNVAKVAKVRASASSFFCSPGREPPDGLSR